MNLNACGDYSRPKGVMGGPCLNCGRSQPEHTDMKKKGSNPPPPSIEHKPPPPPNPPGASPGRMIGELMYTTLKSYPCRCEHNVLYDGCPIKQEVTKQCSGCYAIQKWEELTGKPRSRK